MAPIPEDNQEKPPPRDDEELNAFSNGNVASITFSSDSSDENDDNYPDTTGYMLLPQEPAGYDDADDDTDYEIIENNVNASGHVPEQADRQCESETIDNCGSITENCHDPDGLPDEVIQSEGVAVAPKVTASSTSHHPAFLAKFPDGKIPSYMQVPDIPTNRNDVLWNKKRDGKSSSLDTAEDKKILRAMSGFSLPSENVPEWAKNMSEDQWNDVITQQIRPAPLPRSDNSGQTEQKSDSPPVHGEQKQDGCDWVAEFPDT